MAKQRYINTKIWTDPWFIDLDATEKLLFLYLLTNPNTNIAGVYEISMRQMAFDTNIDQEALKRLFGRFQEAGKVYFEVGWIVIKNFIKHQNLNPKVVIGINTELTNLPNWLRLRIEDENDMLYLDMHSLYTKHGIEYHRLSDSNLIKLNRIKLNTNSGGAAVEKAGLKNLQETKRRLADQKGMT